MAARAPESGPGLPAGVGSPLLSSIPSPSCGRQSSGPIPGLGPPPSDSSREEPAVADNIELIMRFHPVGGEDVALLSSDFAGPEEALEAIARALDERRGLILSRARYNREASENGVVINLANVVSVRVSKTDSDTTGQYL